MIVHTLDLKLFGPTRVIYYRIDEPDINIKIVPVDQDTREYFKDGVKEHHCKDPEAYNKIVHKLFRKVVLSEVN